MKKAIVSLLIVCTCLQYSSFAVVDERILLNPQSYLEIATQYYRNDRYQSSIKICDQLLDIDPENFEANLLLSKNYFELDQLGSASAALKKALEIKPDDQNAKNFQIDVVTDALDKAQEFYNAKQYSKAIILLTKSTQLKDDAVLSLVLLGRSYKKMGDYSQAQVYFKEGLSADPENSMAKAALKEIRKEVDKPIKLVQNSKTKKNSTIITALTKVLNLTRASNTLITDEAWGANLGTLEAGIFSVYFRCFEDTSGNGSNFKNQTFEWNVDLQKSNIEAKNKNAQVLLERW